MAAIVSMSISVESTHHIVIVLSLILGREQA